MTAGFLSIPSPSSLPHPASIFFTIHPTFFWLPPMEIGGSVNYRLPPLSSLPHSAEVQFSRGAFQRSMIQKLSGTDRRAAPRHRNTGGHTPPLPHCRPSPPHKPPRPPKHSSAPAHRPPHPSPPIPPQTSYGRGSFEELPVSTLFCAVPLPHMSRPRPDVC